MNKVLLFSIAMVMVGVTGSIIIQRNLTIDDHHVEIGTVLAEQISPTPVIPAPSPTPASIPQIPTLSAKAYLVVAANDVQPIIEHDSQVQYPPASTTKMMTALVALQNFPLQSVMTIQTPYLVGANIGLEAGEQITVEKILYGLLLNSGNDAAMALADNYEGGPDQFISKMNLLAKELGLNHTQFVNPTGLDHPDHYSTAQDLAALAKVAMTHPLFRQIVGTKQATVTSQDGLITHVFQNRNELLGQSGVIGVKTGYTLTAGEVLVTALERRSGAYYIVVMGSEARFQDTQILIDWLDDYLGTYRISQ